MSLTILCWSFLALSGLSFSCILVGNLVLVFAKIVKAKTTLCGCLLIVSNMYEIVWQGPTNGLGDQGHLGGITLFLGAV